MKGIKAKFGLIGAAAAATVVGGVLLATQVFGIAGEVSADSVDIPPGEEGIAALRADVPDAPGLGAWTIDVTYDPDVVTATDCDGGDVNSVCNTEFGPDTVRVTGASALGEEGEVVLSNITFLCGDAEDTSPLTLTVNVFADATIGDPTDIDPATVVDGEVNCVEPAPPTEAPATATATVAVTAVPDVGQGFTGGDSGNGLSWLIAALAAAGVAGIAGYGALRFRAHRS
jgi:hypothetical protein